MNFKNKSGSSSKRNRFLHIFMNWISLKFKHVFNNLYKRITNVSPSYRCLWTISYTIDGRVETHINIIQILHEWFLFIELEKSVSMCLNLETLIYVIIFDVWIVTRIIYPKIYCFPNHWPLSSRNELIYNLKMYNSIYSLKYNCNHF